MEDSSTFVEEEDQLHRRQLWRKTHQAAQVLSEKLSQELWQGACFGLLPALSDLKSCGWLDGYCCLLAEGLLQWVCAAGEQAVTVCQPRLLVLAGQGRPLDHVVLQVGQHWFLDGDGVSSRRTLLHRWRTRERLTCPRLVPFDERLLAQSEVPRDAQIAGEIAARITQALGPFSPEMLAMASGEELP